jgi:hypothetical protein
LLARRLPHEAFHFQIKKRSENLGRVQAGSFDDVIHVHGFVGAVQFVKLGVKRTGGVMFPGTPKTSLPNSMARRAVISEPLYSSAFDVHSLSI